MPTIPTPDAATLAKWERDGLIPSTTPRTPADPTPGHPEAAGGKKVAQTRRNAKRRGMTEAEFQRQVVEFAELHGWTVYHVPDSRRVTACGFPDLVMMHPTGANPLIAAELKREGEKPRADQVAWLTAFRLAGVPAFVWMPTPECWKEIERVLTDGK